MARPLRYEAAGAVYHIMARGDGGKNIFDDDKDRYAWTDLIEKAHGSYFKIVADYIHLNPGRSGWVRGDSGKRLRSWRWSSFGAYAGNQVAAWLETGRVLRVFDL